MIRVILERWGHAQVLEVDQRDITAGSGPQDQVRLAPNEAAPAHLRLGQRRGSVVLQPHRPVFVSEQPVERVPVVLSHEDEVRVGSYRLRVQVVPDSSRGLLGSSSPWGELLEEVHDRELGVRRYRSVRHEVTVDERSDAGEGARWLERIRPHFPGEGQDAFSGRPAYAVPLPPGRSVRELLAGRSVQPPLEAAFALAIRLAERVGRLHQAGFVHGGLWPERIWVTLDGDVRLLPPGPGPDVQDPLNEPYFPAHRRAGAPCTEAGDLWALQRLVRRWLPEAAVAEQAEGWMAILREQATLWGLDPAAHHLGRWVRVIQARFPREVRT